MKRKYEKPMAFEEVFAAENYCTTACYKIACAIHSNPEPTYGSDKWRNSLYSSRQKDHLGNGDSGCKNPNLNRILVNSDGSFKVEEYSRMIEEAIQSDGIEELFETGKHISVDIFSDEYMNKINAIQLPNTKIKILQRLLSQAIDEFKKVNKIMGVEFADRLKKVVDEYNNRRRDEAYANEVLDDVAEQLAQLLSELKTEKNSFKNMGIDYEEKAFYDILKAVSKKFEFEYPDDKMIELSKRIKLIVDDKSRYTDWSARDDIKANLQVDLILLLDEFGYPPVTIDDVYKEVLEQAENFKKYAQ